MRLAVTGLALGLLGAAFVPAHVEPATQHVRWSIRHGDLVATADFDVRTATDSVVNVPGIFPMTARRAATQFHPHLRIVVAGRTAFDRGLTSAEARRLGDLEALHIANDVRRAGERDIAATGTAMLQYQRSPARYRVVDAVVGPDFGPASLSTGCDRAGSFERARTVAYAGETVRITQRGSRWYCLRAQPDEAELTITSGGKTAYREHAVMSRRGAVPPGAAGVLQLTDGPAFVDFERTGKPAVVLTGTTGGAHCCFETHVFFPTAEHGYAEAVRVWGNGYSYPALVHDPRSGEILFGSSNDAFAWMFIGYAHAIEPVQILAFEHGRFLDVTPAYPDIVNEQAARIWATAREAQRTGRMRIAQVALAAYLADMSILDRAAEGWRNAERLCTAPECVQYLGEVRLRLREINYR